MRPRTPAQRYTPYAVQFRQVCGAIAAYAPGDETRKLHAVRPALVALPVLFAWYWTQDPEVVP